MRYAYSLLLILVLFSCSSPVGHAVKDLGKGVKKCCTSLSLEKPNTVIKTSVTAAAAELPVMPVSVLEGGSHMLTW